MSHISESIPDLLGGVSQLAPQRREVNEVESMVNCSLRPAEGVTKRPPTKWIAEIASSASAYSGAFVHTINKNSTERFWVIVLDGDLKVFNAVTGVEVPVSFPDGKTYLDVVASPNEAFRLATFNQTTVIVNREKTVGRSSELSADRGHEALVVVQQTDYDTEYHVFVGFDGPPEFNSAGINIGPPSTRITLRIGAHDELDANGKPPSLSTINAAYSLAYGIDQEYGFFAQHLSGLKNLLLVRTHGSTIHISPGVDLEPGAEFWIHTSDDLANQGLQTVQGSVQSIDNLPSEGPVGFRIKVEGDPEKSLDDVFYEFTENGTWKETNESGIPIALDPATLPLELVHGPDLLQDRFPAQVPTSSYSAGGYKSYGGTWLETQDGTPSTDTQLIIGAQAGNQIDKFIDLTNANGSPIKMSITVVLDAQYAIGPGPSPLNPSVNYAGDTHTIEVAHDQVSPGNYVTVYSHIVTPGTKGKFIIKLDFDDDPIDAGTNVRFSVISANGNLGALMVRAYGTSIFSPIGSIVYAQTEEAGVSLPDSHYAPGSDMTFTLNGTAFVHDFAAGGTQAAYGAALKTAIEAYGGSPAVTAVFSSSDKGRGKVLITNDDGTTPIVTLFTFDDNIASATQYFNGSADFVNLGVVVGSPIKNLTDVSEAVVSVVATTLLTHDALSGGTANVWKAGNKSSVETSTLSFACRQPDWAKRLVGTEETNKWPTFEGETINEVSFLKNRLILLSDENIAMSVVDKFFTFFRTSTLDVLDSDRIDVALSGNKTSSLHSAFTWNETLLTWSELGQFVVNGEPFLSPNTVRREATTAYVNTRKVKPVTSERAVYFLTEGKEFCQLWDYKPTSNDATSAEGNRLSVQVPRFLPGTPRGLLAISDPEIVLVLTATAPEKLYVFSHLVQEQQRTMGGWHEWQFAGVTPILGMGSIDNEVSLVLERDDGKVHLEVIDLWELSESTVDGQEESDDHSTPPFFGPNQVVLGKDTFTEAVDDTLVTSPSHTPDVGFGGWEYDGTENISAGPVYEGGYAGLDISSEDNVLQMNCSAGAAFRCTSEIGDGDMHAFIDMKVTQTGGVFNGIFNLLVNSSRDPDSSVRREGVGLTINATQPNGIVVRATRYHAEFEQEGADVLTDANYPTDTVKRFGFRRVGQVLTYYSADRITGANETSLGSFTIGSGSTTGVALLADGLHTGVSFWCGGGRNPISNNWEWDNLTVVADTPGGGSSTFFTPDGLDPDDFSTLVGIDESGDEQALISNGDGTVKWPTDDKTGENIIIGLPVASTIVLSQLYHRKNFGPYAGKAEIRGNTYINNLLLGLQDTTTMDIAVAITGHATFNQDLAEVRSLDAEYMHVQVGGRNTETTLTLTSSNASNFKIVGLDWEGVFYNRNRRMS